MCRYKKVKIKKKINIELKRSSSLLAYWNNK